MEAIKELVRNVVIIILLTTFLDMLLPSGSLRPFIKVVMGLFVLLCILNPLLSFFRDEQEYDVFAWQQDTPLESFSSVTADSNRLLEVNQKVFLDSYAARVALQMEAMLRLIDGVQDSAVEVILAGGRGIGALEGIREANVKVKRTETAAATEKSIETEIISTLTNYFGLKPTQISVIFVEV